MAFKKAAPQQARFKAGFYGKRRLTCPESAGRSAGGDRTLPEATNGGDGMHVRLRDETCEKRSALRHSDARPDRVASTSGQASRWRVVVLRSASAQHGCDVRVP